MKFLSSRTCLVAFRTIRNASSEAVVDKASEKTVDAVVDVSVRYPQLPLVNLGDRKLPFLNPYEKPKQAWVESFDTLEEKKLGVVDLHPAIFGEMPRIDIIQENVKWQRLYRFVCYAHTKVRSEVRGGGRKPWPQKGTGRARHGSIRSPLWRGGGIAHGPRSPTPHFYMLPFHQRLLGLTSTLSVKLAQDDLHIVADLEIPTDDPEYLQSLIETRNWGVSVLVIDSDDIMPRNISIAAEGIQHFNLMPYYGLNVYSMLKHETLVLTLSALEKLEERLLYNIHRIDANEKTKKFRVDQV